MTRAYFFNGAHYGHVYPTLGLVRELVRRGEEVIYFAGEAFRSVVEPTGATFRTYTVDRPEETIRSVEQFAAALLEYGALVLPELIDQARVDRPDYIVFDMQRVWGWLLARKLGIPAICSSPSFALTAPVLQTLTPGLVSDLNAAAESGAVRPDAVRYARAAAGLKAGYGLDSPSMLETVAMTGDITLVFTTRRIQPAAELLDSTFHFVGPSLAERSEAADFPFESLTDRRGIFISLGTIFNDQAAFYRNCVRAFADTDYAVVMSVGDNVNIDSVGAVPGNFVVRRFVPQLEVLRRSDVFVTHAGMGSVHEALHFGVPMAMYPQMAEQSFVASRIAALGAGIQLTRMDGRGASLTTTEVPGVEAIRAGVEAVMRDPAYRRNARRLAREFRADTPAHAADIVDAFVTRQLARVA
jgi:MGT family glycosyltransferase